MKRIWLVLLCFLCTACGFHLQGETQLAPALHTLYLQTSDPYGHLIRNLKQNLKMSNVKLVSTPAEAKTILNIMSETTTQNFLSVSGTQQVRQYQLVASVTFEITDKVGRTIIGPQTLTEKRAMTVQANQILASSNEANLFYEQMRRALVYNIMNRLSSAEVTKAIDSAFAPPPKPVKKIIKRKHSS